MGRPAKQVQAPGEGASAVVTFPTVGRAAALVAMWKGQVMPEGSSALLEDAAHSLQLALEREEVAIAHQETAALRRSQEMQQGFLSRLSHELRTPLTAIRGYASSLLQPDVTWDMGSQQRFLSRVAAESARLGRLVEDLLDFSAIESGIFGSTATGATSPSWWTPRWRAFRLPTGSGWSSSTTPGLPAVWADHDRMEQVLLNLMDNALKHNPEGTHVRVGTVADGATVLISISDDGSGVPDDVAAAFFDPERRRRTETAGAGLGLSIASGIVEAHGGTIELVRDNGRGARVIVRIPIEGGRPIEAFGASANV